MLSLCLRSILSSRGGFRAGLSQEEEQRERDDIMLGKKKVDFENLEDNKREQRAAIVDEEAKIREDPLSELVESPSSQLPAKVSPSHRARQKALRKERKEQRRKNQSN